MTGQLAQTAFSGPSLSLGGTISPQKAMLQTLDHDFKSLWPQMLSESSLPLILRPIETSLARRCPRSFHRSTFIVKTLRHRLPLPRQRMDFLLLLPGRQRIVIEVDGKHHFTENDHPSLKVYADMVSAVRELRLAGYEIYRFGANELVGDGAAPRISDFFEKLFRLHRLI
ncbi:hypothetical protein RZO85_02700 [Raoultella ornithinolytica]|uniref:hypothetical protein n=1 Tax=Raoultella ornithinolytica TaxID=54291 RepID=UPI00292B2B6F|nr:hypothetical protein [Raoultella ornithinolytica]MDV0598630.1 hypothetical protein [Raoultella ornithinolytica]